MDFALVKKKKKSHVKIREFPKWLEARGCGLVMLRLDRCRALLWLGSIVALKERRDHLTTYLTNPYSPTHPLNLMTMEYSRVLLPLLLNLIYTRTYMLFINNNIGVFCISTHILLEQLNIASKDIKYIYISFSIWYKCASLL